MNRILRIFSALTVAAVLTSGALAAEPAARVDLNKASVEELDKLPKVGPAVAQRIVEYRKQNGGFRRPEDLMQVRGIGPKIFELIKDRITVGDAAAKPAAPAAPAAR